MNSNKPIDSYNEDELEDAAKVEDVIKGDVELYLKSLKKLDGVVDDYRLWSEEGQRQIEEEMHRVSMQKEQFVLSIKDRARSVKLSRAELICRECRNTICAYFNVTPVGYTTAVSGKFVIIGIFATVKMLTELRQEQKDCEFIQNFQDDISQVEAWASCSEGHIIGWQTQGKCVIDHTSPLLLLMPTSDIWH